MRYWWVNQNQTFAQEFKGGYLWSPKRKSNGAINPYYEFMREVAPGDVIFCFEGTRIRALGIAQSPSYGAPKPEEFGAAGLNWSHIGWKIEVRYFELHAQIRPADSMAILGPLFQQQRYAPLQANGRGNQAVYLTTVNERAAAALIAFIGFEARQIIQANAVEERVIEADTAMPDILRWEDHIAETITSTPNISATEREALVMARRGQGLFKRNVSFIERRCRITGVERIEHLVASHVKPWRDCQTHDERLDGENGLLLTPSIDHLFDRGFISFEDNGDVLVSNVADGESLRKMGVPVGKRHNVGPFSEGQREYLGFHRQNIFLAANLQRTRRRL